MDHPKKQIPHIIHSLTTGSPSEQKDAIETFFLPTASFTHPLCRVPSFSSSFFGEINSRWVIWMIYRWYKFLSPTIILDVESAEFNQKSQILYVSIRQVFSIWFVPFYKSNVHLTTILQLEMREGDGKYYIKSQEDLYQMNELVKFFWPGGDWVVWVGQAFATGLCILGAVVTAPWSWVVQRHANQVNGTRKGL